MVMEEFADIFASKERMGYVIESILKELFPPTAGDVEKFIQEHQIYNIKTCFDIIFTNAESPIEKIFLNSLVARFVFDDPLFIIFTNPLPSATEECAKAREMIARVVEMCQEVQRLSEDKTHYAFTDLIMRLDDIPETFRYHMCDIYMNYVMFNQKDKFHLSMQSTFTDIQINSKNIRPDIFIWLPGDPTFKLIVECDGYAYHSDRTAFSNDRARDRLLQAKGFQVLRFSGHEISTDPLGKSKELYEYLVAQAKSRCSPYTMFL